MNENIGKLKNQPVKNGVQVIENKAQSNFGLNENINGLKNQSAKNGEQVIETIRELKNQFSENKAHPNFGVSENINGLVYERKGEVHCPEFSGECQV